MANKKLYQGMRADIIATRKALSGARVGEYKWTASALGSINGNLNSTLGGGRANLSAEQARMLGKLSALKQNQDKRSRAITRGAKANVSSMYGSAIGGANRVGQSTVAAAGKGARMAVAGQAGAGGILARGDKAAMATLQQGATAAASAADAQLADALAYRAKNDASLVAQQQLQLDQMRLQNKLDIQNYKAKLALQAKADGSAGNAAASALANVAADTVPSLIGYFNDPSLAVANPNSVSPAEAAAAWAVANGVDPNSAQYQVVLAAAQAIRASNDANGGSYDPADISNSVTQQLAIMYPDLKPKQLDMLGGIVTGSTANWNIAAQQAAAAPEGTPGSGVRVGVSTDGNPRHEIEEISGRQVRGIVGDIGYIQDDGTVRWQS